MGKNKVIRYEGKLYKNYWSLFYDLEEAGLTPCKTSGGDPEEEYPMEKYILTEIMKLEIQEEPVY